VEQRKPTIKLEAKEHYHLAFLDPYEQLINPAMVHEVTENRSLSNRLSLAMNFGAS